MKATGKEAAPGRMADIQWGGKVWLANVMDMVAGTKRAKRVRIQNPGPDQGKVLMPGEYIFLEWVT